MTHGRRKADTRGQIPLLHNSRAEKCARECRIMTKTFPVFLLIVFMAWYKTVTAGNEGKKLSFLAYQSQMAFSNYCEKCSFLMELLQLCGHGLYICRDGFFVPKCPWALANVSKIFPLANAEVQLLLQVPKPFLCFLWVRNGKVGQAKLKTENRPPKWKLFQENIKEQLLLMVGFWFLF